MTKLKNIEQLDSYDTTKSKVKKWHEKSSMMGVGSAWELRKILSQSMYIKNIKDFVANLAPNSNGYKNSEEYWIYGLENLAEESVIDILLTVVSRELKITVKRLSMVRTQRYTSGIENVFQRHFEEDIVVEKDNICIIVSEKTKK